MLNYTLEIQSSFSEVVKHFIEPQHFNVIIGNLSENREYSFRIVVTNAIGNASSSDRQFCEFICLTIPFMQSQCQYLVLYNIDTTDVQLVTADFDESSDDIIVQCTFIPGSDTQGCMVVLVGESENTTINLTRKGFDTVAVEMINVTCPIINYTQVIGYDIESDESIGLLAVHGKLSFNNRNTFCLPINHGMESTLSK